MNNSQFAMSLDMVNRHYCEPNRNRYESKYYWEELYTLINAAGFDAIEIPFEPVWQFGGRSGVPMTTYSIETKYGDINTYKKSLAQSGIQRVSAITFDANLFVRNPSIDFYYGASEHFATQAIDFASQLGATCLVLSPSAWFGRLAHYHADIAEQLPTHIERTSELVSRLVEKASAAGVVVTLRPEYWSLFSPQQVVEMATRTGAKLTVNTAHLALANVEVANFIKEHISLIHYVQLSDTELSTADSFKHEPNPAFPPKAATQVFSDVDDGKLDMSLVMTILNKLQYQGPIGFCNHQTRDPMRAMLRNRRFINALSIANEGES